MAAVSFGSVELSRRWLRILLDAEPQLLRIRLCAGLPCAVGICDSATARRWDAQPAHDGRRGNGPDPRGWRKHEWKLEADRPDHSGPRRKSRPWWRLGFRKRRSPPWL